MVLVIVTTTRMIVTMTLFCCRPEFAVPDIPTEETPAIPTPEWKQDSEDPCGDKPGLAFPASASAENWLGTASYELEEQMAWEVHHFHHRQHHGP